MSEIPNQNIENNMVNDARTNDEGISPSRYLIIQQVGIGCCPITVRVKSRRKWSQDSVLL